MKKKKIIWLSIILIVIFPLIYSFKEGKPLPKYTVIDKLIVIKSKREMQTWHKGKIIKTYKISLGRNPVGPKEVEGDNKTPEGIYYISGKDPNSKYHKNLGVSYPNMEDKARAKQMGRSPGGQIKIHGLSNKIRYAGKFHYWLDWTQGCIAVTDREIEELYEAVKIGTPFEIRP